MHLLQSFSAPIVSILGYEKLSTSVWLTVMLTRYLWRIEYVFDTSLLTNNT